MLFLKTKKFRSRLSFLQTLICSAYVLLSVFLLFPVDAYAGSLANYNVTWLLGGTNSDAIVSPGGSGSVVIREMASVGYYDRQTKVNAGETYNYDIIDFYIDYHIPLSFIIHSPNSMVTSGSTNFNLTIAPPYLLSDPSGTISDVGWWTCSLVDVVGTGSVSASAQVSRASGATSARITGKVSFNDRLVSNGVDVGSFTLIVRCVYRWEYDSSQNYIQYYNFNQIMSKYQDATVVLNNSSGTAFVYVSPDDSGSAFSDAQKAEIDSAVSQQDSVQGSAMSHVDSYAFPDVDASAYSGGSSFITSSVNLFTNYPALLLLLGCALAFCIVRKVLY